ncbi:hypothetical protein M9H77_30854 [Catharanthus roseus]|uniref:Uncharacterized protein n=1 Tax=Catharanthus roseus TaxID=4058 RepID=A0ACB9ZYF8_CATRO|nr:hypothetical protein M9H77_30854 [Catharanthus roseus]
MGSCCRDLAIPRYLSLSKASLSGGPGLGWAPLLRISGDYYPALVQEFSANMTHTTNKDLQTIISIVKTGRIILDKEHLASILGIPHTGNSVTVDSNRKIIDENLDLNLIWLVAILRSGCGHWTIAVSSTGAIFRIFFIELLLISLGTHLFKRGRFFLPVMSILQENEDYQQDCSRTMRTKCGSHYSKKIDYKNKTTQTGLRTYSSQRVENDDEANESYNPSDDEEDEIDQEIKGMQLAIIVESTRRHADELAHQRALIDREECGDGFPICINRFISTGC